MAFQSLKYWGSGRPVVSCTGRRGIFTMPDSMASTSGNAYDTSPHGAMASISPVTLEQLEAVARETGVAVALQMKELHRNRFVTFRQRKLSSQADGNGSDVPRPTGANSTGHVSPTARPSSP